MPKKLKPLEFKPKFPAWVEKLEGPLRTKMYRALLDRRFAERHGATKYADTRKILEAADAIIDTIERKKVVGAIALKKADEAIEKYDEAMTNAQPGMRKGARRRAA